MDPLPRVRPGRPRQAVEQGPQIADGNLAPGQRTPDRWFDTAAFVAAPLYTFGTSGRNVGFLMVAPAEPYNEAEKKATLARLKDTFARIA